jgi:hypothetical protein
MKIGNYSVNIENFKNNSQGYVYLPHKAQYKIILKSFADFDSMCQLEIDGANCGFYLLKANSKLIIDSPNVGDDDGLFTFYKIDSEEGELISEDVAAENFGLVQVKFVAIKKDTNPEQIKTIINNYFNYGTYRWWIDYYYNRYEYPTNVMPLWKINTSDLHYMSVGGTTYDTVNQTITTTSHSANDPVFTTTLNQAQSVSQGGVTGLSGYSYKTYEKPKETDYLLLDTLTTISLRLVASNEAESDKPRKITGFSNPIPPAIF